jgi:hypothetical protein
MSRLFAMSNIVSLSCVEYLTEVCVCVCVCVCMCVCPREGREGSYDKERAMLKAPGQREQIVVGDERAIKTNQAQRESE